MNRKTDVVVIGGGYAGVMAADRLTRDGSVSVTLVNPRPVFVERIRLHQRVVGSDDAVVAYQDVLAGDVRLVVDVAERIDPAQRSVLLAGGDRLRYDFLVYAAGSRSARPRVPGAAELALPLADLEQADRLRDALNGMPPDARVTVVGAGPSGIETAAELAEAGRRVTLVSGEALGPYLASSGRRFVARRLDRLGVTVLAGTGSAVVEVAEDAVRLADGRRVAGDLVVWTAGFGVPELARRSGLRTDDAGRLLTDETLTSVDDERIVAAGDSAAPSDRPLRMSCQAALPLGARAADTVLARIAGLPPAPASVGFFGMCLSLGRASGVFQVARRSDTATPWRIAGRAGALLKETVCRQTVSALARESRRPGSARWIADRTRADRLRESSAPAVSSR